MTPDRLPAAGASDKISGVGRHFFLRCLAAALTVLLYACGGSSPSAPSGGSQIPSGAQVLRLTFQSPCTPPGGNVLSLSPLVYTRVQVRESGGEWIATSSAAAGGDVELRFRSTGAMPAGGMRLAGSIAGTARHMPEIVPNLPSWESFIDFGSDRRTVVDGVAFSVIGTTPSTGVDGIGSGSITLRNSSGASCSGSAFSWSMGPNF